MDENASLPERFEKDRIRLRAVAYRMLGSVTEADDAVQETWLRLSRTADAHSRITRTGRSGETGTRRPASRTSPAG